MRTGVFIGFLLFLGSITFVSYSNTVYKEYRILIEIKDAQPDDPTLIAIDRIERYSGALTAVVDLPATEKSRRQYDLTIMLGAKDDSPELQRQWEKHKNPKKDAWLVRSVTEDPLVIAVSGLDKRGMLYAAYHLADLLKAGSDVSKLDLYFQPKVDKRYLSVGTTTHGRRYFRPQMYSHNLNEMPRYGYNGVLIYPGGGTPIGRQTSPVLEDEEGNFYSDAGNALKFNNWFRDIKKYRMDIMMTIAPVIPPGYDKQALNDFYAGGPEPEGYIDNLQLHFRKFLEILEQDYPEFEMYLFNSTEGATFGNNKRFFGDPHPERFSNDAYVRNNGRIMRAYFDVLKDHFKSDLNKVAFWTHSYGLTSDGIVKMREVLFEYPQVTIVEDDFWNNNLWPFDIPSMKYLPEDLRKIIHTKNPYALFQIATDAEYFGGGNLPNAYPGSHIRTAKDALERNAAMVIQRIDLHGRTPEGTLFGSVEIIPLAASKQLWEPTPDEALIWKEWAGRRYGKDAAPYVVNALQESKNILLNGFAAEGLDLLAWGSEINPRFWYKRETSRYGLFSRPGVPFVNKTSDSVIFSPEYTAYQMNTHSIPIKKYLNDRDSALKSIEYGLKEIEKARPFLEQKDYESLKNMFVLGRNVVEALKLVGKAAYASNLVMDNYDHVKDPEKLFNDAISDLEAFIKKGGLMDEMNGNLESIISNYKKTLHEKFNE